MAELWVVEYQLQPGYSWIANPSRVFETESEAKDEYERASMAHPDTQYRVTRFTARPSQPGKEGGNS